MKNIITHLYYLDQQGTQEYVKEVLIAKKVPFYEYEGNIVSLRNEGMPIFVAHMDTVDDKDITTKKLAYDKNKNCLFRLDNGILGADDKAGVNLILNHCENINFILTVDEERGALGIQDLVTHQNFLDTLPSYSCCIELDRMGSHDIIGAEHGYCGKDFEDKLKTILDYKGTWGVFTDVDYLCDKIACVNLSVGYYSQHTSKEYLNLDHFDYINSKILELSTITGTFEKGNVISKWGSYSYWDEEDWKKWDREYYLDSLDKEECKEWDEEQYYKNLALMTDDEFDAYCNSLYSLK